MAKIKMSTLATVAIFIATFKAQGLPDTVQYAVQLSMLGVVILYLLFQRKKIHVLNISLFFSGALLLSSVVAYFTDIISLVNMFNGIFYSVCLFCFYEIIVLYAEKNNFYGLVKILFRISIVYNILSLISVMKVGNIDSQIQTYFLGGKFVTSYYFIFMMALMYTLYHTKIQKSIKWKVYYVGVTLITIGFSVYIKCTTALVITIVMFILSLVSQRMRDFFSQKITVVSFVLASGAIIFVLQYILSLDIVQYFIVDVLGKSISLTARTPIYERHLFPLISERLFLGYGYSSSILHRTTPYWNAQNGLFEIILNYGLIGGVAFIATVYKCVGNKNSNTDGWGLYMLLYAFIVAATIEVSFNYIFIIVLYLLFAIQMLPNIKD